ncbi:calcium-binding protein [Azospirillum brasilense]|uniref:calcium-binding protein n=1 Tax=Azospirillum brasilense TaxID=192 RepID=UPI001EDAB08E|nr:calcium-binding protein [Azospirillum brasilense]UKJ76024.1 cadherin-like domain-containing protein [Azospirillum brasilense]
MTDTTTPVANAVINGDWRTETLLGGAGHDTIASGGGGGFIDGGAGNDVLTGNWGDDSILGGAGNDRIDGGENNDTLDGGSGDDTIYGGGGMDRITAGEGDDTVYGDGGADRVDGGDGNDVLYGGDGDDSILGGAGNDRMGEGGGYWNNDLYDGGDGDDTLDGGYGSDTLLGGAGNDSLTVGNDYNGDRLDGGAGDDTLTGGMGADTLIGGDGGDLVQGGGGDDLAIQSLSTQTRADTLDGGAGSDRLRVELTSAQITGAVAGELVRLRDFIRQHGDDGQTFTSDALKLAARNWNALEVLVDGVAADVGSLASRANSAPVVSDQTLAGTEDTVLTGSVGAVDADNDALSYAVTEGPAHGILSLTAGGLFTYTPGANYAGTDLFRITVSDGRGGVATQTVTITLAEVNDAPTSATLTGGRMDEDAPAGTVVGTVQAADPEGGTLAYSLLDDAGGRFTIDAATGRIAVAEGASLDAGAAPAHAVTVRVTDDGGLSTDTVLYIDVTDGRNDGAPDENGLAASVELAAEAGEVRDGSGVAIGGSWQAETVSGGGGDDTLSSGGGGGALHGGAGNDVVTGDWGDDSLDGGSGNDTLTGGSQADVLSGGSGDDVLSGGSENDTLYGGSGNDTLIGGSNEDVLYGGLGDDLLDGGTNANTLYGGAGDDTLLGGGNEDLLDGGSGDDRIVAGTGNDSIRGGAGNDWIDAGENDDTIDAGSGNDVVLAGGGADRITAGDGDDTVYGDGGTDHVDGGDGNDVLYGGEGDDTLLGGAGNDRLGEGGSYWSNDRYDGGDGDDTLEGGFGSDTLIGGAGNDSLSVGDDYNGDLLDGGDGDDTLVGGMGDDTLIGGDGDDVLSGGGGHNVLIGGDGIDTVDFGAGSGPIAVDLSNGGVQHGGWMSDSLSGIENVRGGAGNDTLIGDAGDNQFSGGAGEDSLDGAAGNDSLEGGAGADTLIGGEGTDTVAYSGSAGGVTVDLVAGTGAGGDAEGDRISGVEDITGSSHDDHLTGDGGANRIDGAAGDDTLIGGAAADTLIGGEGTDTADYSASPEAVTVDLDAGTGHGGDAEGDILTGIENVIGSAFGDRLTGNGGGNRLDGGAGDDTLAGGAGPDTLVGGEGTDTADYSASAVAVTVNLTTGLGSGGNAQGDRLSGIENLLGSDGNDRLTGDSGGNRIDGRAGNDTLAGLGGADTLIGGAGTDTADYSASTAAVTVDLATGTGLGGDAEGDVLAGLENVTGSSRNDRLTGDGGANRLDGAAGDDTLIGGAGADTLVGGAGTDTADYTASGAAVTVSLASGTGTGGDAQGDRLSGIENLLGSGGNDRLTGDANRNRLDGQGGNDTLAGLGGADTLIGGEGTDTAEYLASANGVTVDLSTGLGTGGDAEGDRLTDIENLTGSNQADRLTGDAGDNRLDGAAGDDTLIGGEGADTLVGGAGTDTADYSASADAVVVDLAAGTGSGGTAEGDRLNGVENLIGSALDDRLTGDGLDNVLKGGAGADTLEGGGGADTADYSGSDAGVTVDLTTGTGLGGDAEGDRLTSIENLSGSGHADLLIGDGGANRLDGAEGDDTLIGGAGADTLVGGAGIDTADYSASAAGVTVDLAAGTGSGGDAEGDRLSEVERVIATGQADSLTGDGEDNYLDGRGGADALAGGAGNDTLRVLDEGFVSVDGGSGDDTLRFEGNRLMLLGTAVNVHRIERFDLTAEGHQTLIFNEQGVRANAAGAPLYVTGDRDDFVTFKESGWRRVGTLIEDGVLYNSYRRGDSVVNVQDGIRMFGDLVLTGTPGDDVITAPSGAGHVVVFGEGGNDIVRLGAGFRHEIAHLVRIDDDLHILFDAGGGPAGEDGYARDRVTIMEHFAANGAAGAGIGGIREFVFADGVVWPVWGDILLMGGTGDDTIAIEPGFTSRTVHADDGTNVIRFGGDVTAADLRLSRRGDDLEIRIAGTDRSVIAFNHFSADVLAGAGNGGIQAIELADGTVWRVSGADIVISTTGNDTTVFGLGGGEVTLYGSEGTDTISFALTIDPDRMRLTREGDDLRIAYTGSSDSWIVKNHFDGNPDGVSTIRFGDGTAWAIDNTRLIVGTGSDEVFTIAAGLGGRVLAGGGGTDGLVLGVGIRPTDVALSRDGNALVIGIAGTADRVTVLNHFDGLAAGNSGLRTITFADGTVWSIGAAEGFRIGGDTADLFTVKPGDGAVTLFVGKGFDTLTFGTGIPTDKLSFVREGENLVIAVQGSAERITVLNHFATGWGASVLENVVVGGRTWRLTDPNVLVGSAGDDSFTLAPGTGSRIVLPGIGTDQITIGQGIDPANVRLQRVGDDLVVTVYGLGDTLTVLNHFAGGASGGVHSIRFVDGNIWNIWGHQIQLGGSSTETFEAKPGVGHVSIYPGGGTDVLRFDPRIDSLGTVLRRSGGDLEIVMGDGGDVVTILNHFLGNALRSVAFGDGKVWTVGGNGVQVGTDGDDVFTLTPGMGNVIVYGGGKANGDRIVAAPGVDPKDLRLTRVGNDLRVTLGADSMTIVNQFASGGVVMIPEIIFLNGVVWPIAGSTVHISGGGRETLPAAPIIYPGGPGQHLSIDADPGKTRVVRVGADLHITIEGRQDEIVVVNHFAMDGVGDLVFDNGTTWNIQGGKVLIGGSGHDEFVIQAGMGDVILYPDTSGDDRVRIVDSVDGSKIRLTRFGDDLRVTVDGTKDSLTIVNHFAGAPLEAIQRPDGTMMPLTGDTVVFGGKGPTQFLVGRDTGSQTIYTEGGDSLVFSDIDSTEVVMFRTGSDLEIHIDRTSQVITVLNYYGAIKDLTFPDGRSFDLSSRDTLIGGGRGDVFQIGKTGPAQQVIHSGGGGTINFGPDVGPGDVTLARDGNDLLVVFIGSGRTVRVVNQFAPPTEGMSRGLEAVTFSGGKTVNVWGENVVFGDAGTDDFTILPGQGRLYVFPGGGTDRLTLGPGIAPADVRMERDGVDLRIFTDDGRIDLIAVNHFGPNGVAGSGSGLGTVAYGNGQVWTVGGNGILIGSLGNSTFNVGANSGPTTIHPGGGLNRLSFTAGVPPANLRLVRIHDDLRIISADGTVNILVVNHFENRLDEVSFPSGPSWNLGVEHVWIGGDGPSVFQLDDLGSDQTVFPGSGDTVGLPPGLDWKDVVLSRSGSDLVVVIRETGRQIRIVNHFSYSDGTTGLAGLQFADGTTLPLGELAMLGGTTGDLLTGTATDDVLLGQDGDDRLSGGGGNDTLVGGIGNDTLDGGAGNDTYVYRPGDGRDTLLDTSGFDAIEMGPGITRGGIYFARFGNDLHIRFRDRPADEIIVTGRFNLAGDGASYVEWIDFADGTRFDLTRTDIALETVATAANEQLFGYNVGDRIEGKAGNDSILGYAGDDTLIGGTGSDSLDGGAGNDLLDSRDDPGTDGARDVAYGRDGDDTILGGGGNDLLYGGTGSDSIDGGEGDNSIDGEDGDDLLIAGSGHDTVYGRAGNDTLAAGAGNDTLYTGAGDDLIRYGGGSDTITNEGGNDVLELGPGIAPEEVYFARFGKDLYVRFRNSGEQIVLTGRFNGAGDGTSFVQTLRFADGSTFDVTRKDIALETVANPASEVLEGYNVRDVIRGMAGNDTIYGYADNDTLDGGAGSDSILGGTGGDSLEGGDGGDTLDGETGDDTLSGGLGNDFLYGGAGRDTLSGGDGADYLYGGADDDILNGDAGNDTLEGGDGNDTLTGGEGTDTLFTGLGDDLVRYDGGRETISNIGGQDVLEIGVGLSASDLYFARFADNLHLRFRGRSDEVILANRFSGAGDGASYLQTLRFADGTLVDITNPMLVLDTVATDAYEKLEGYNANDTIQGLGGVDTIYGYAGDDLLDGGAGNDLLYGGAGDDRLLGNIGDDRLEGGDGNDTLEGGDGNDLHYGEAGDDVIAAGNGTDYVEGGAGDDTVSGGAGEDTVFGGAGKDSLSGDDGNDSLYGEAGDDTLEGGAGTNTISTGLGDDLIRHSGGRDTIANEGGRDVLEMRAGLSKADLYYARFGNDLYLRFRNAADEIVLRNRFNGAADGASYVQTLRFADGALADITDPALVLETVATDATERLEGYNVNDTIRGLGGHDTISGYAGDDVLDGGTGNDLLYGGAGDDTLTGGAGTDQLYGDAGDDLLLGGDGNDSLNGGDGDDTLIGGLGADQYYGGAGNDWIDNSDDGGTGASVDVAYGEAGNDTIIGGDGGETFGGGDGDDSLLGNAGNDWLEGNAGDDWVEGATGNDTLKGGDGNDTLLGGSGTNTISTGLGDDLIRHSGGRDIITNEGGQDVLEMRAGLSKADLYYARFGNDLYLRFRNAADEVVLTSRFSGAADGASYVQTLRFADGALADITDPALVLETVATDATETLQGYNVNDTIRGLGGNDAIYGYAGDDLLDGGLGADTLYGGAGDDSLIGGDGSDSLEGGDGIDTLEGGNGNDTLLGDDGDDTLIGGAGNDVIHSGGGNDLIRFDSGQDTIHNTGGDDVVDLGAAFASGSYYFVRYGADLYVRFQGVSDQIIIASRFNGGGDGASYVQTLRFADGTLVDLTRQDLVIRTVDSNAGQRLEGYRVGDFIDGQGGNDTILGYSGDDTLIGGGGVNQLYGGDGNDLLDGRSGQNESLYGEAGDDTVYGSAGSDGLQGGTGDDVLDAGAGNDIAFGGDGDDTIVGGSGEDRLWGDGFSTTGNEVIVIRIRMGGHITWFWPRTIVTLDGTVLMDARVDVHYSNLGQDGSSTAYKGNTQDFVFTVRDRSEADRLQIHVVSEYQGSSLARAGVYIAGIEVAGYPFSGGWYIWEGGTSTWGLDSILPSPSPTEAAGNDIVSAGDGNDCIGGGVGDDELDGGTGNDTILGGAGNDTIRGGAGSDEMHGGAGDDLIDNRDDPNAGGINDMSYGGTGRDTIYGGGGTDVSYGGAGDDLIDGGAGKDTLFGEAGNDSIRGGADNDQLYGQDGNDTLDGGAGNDSLDGGAGDDLFLYAGSGQGQDSVRGGGGNDVLELGAGLAAEQLYLSRFGDDLYLTFRDTGDRIAVVGRFTGEGDGVNYVQTLRFADGSVVDLTAPDVALETYGLAAGETLRGYRMGDRIEGSGGNDSILGYGGDDTLKGGDGADALYGGLGDDVLDGGAGADYLEGGDGNDSLSGGTESDTLFGGFGNDTLNGGTGANGIDGGAGDDLVVYGGGTDTIVGGGGNDVLVFGEGYGADGMRLERYGKDLHLVFAATAQRIVIANRFTTTGAGDGANYLQTLRFVDGTEIDLSRSDIVVTTNDDNAGHTLEGYNAGDVIRGNGGTDSIYGYGGDDTLYGGAGVDRLYGGDGDDLIDGRDDTVGDAAYGDGGNDTLLGGTGGDALYGGDGDDWIDGGAGNDSMEGGAGDDRMDGGSGIDTINGGVGNDILNGGTGNDILNGGAGNDVIDGGDDADTLYGEDGDDTLAGGLGNDSINTGAGDDLVLYQGGRDTITGGGGNDTLAFGEGFDADGLRFERFGADLHILFDGLPDRIVVVNRFNGTGDGANYLKTLRFADGSTYDLSRQDLVIDTWDDSARHTLEGYKVADVIRGNGGDDVIYGYGGDDSLHGGAGADLVRGGDGDDLIDSSDDGASFDTLYGDAGQDTIFGGGGNDTLYGGDGDDRLDGGGGNDSVDGGAGADTLSGDVGSDLLFGGSGNDAIDGGAGNDALFGEAGDDTLSGGAGDDSIDAGLGDDLILYEGGRDTILGGGGNDVLSMGEGFSADQLHCARFGTFLVLRFHDRDEQIVIANRFNGTGNGTNYLQTVRFADGTEVDLSAQDLPLLTVGGETTETLWGYAGDDWIDGGGGNDTLFGEGGNDTLIGGSGWDELHGGGGSDLLDCRGDAGSSDVAYGEAGDDTLIGGGGNDQLSGGDGDDDLYGGAGNDTLAGGPGNDTYRFAPGGGNDRIVENDADTGTDRLVFDSAVDPHQLWFRKVGTDLELQLVGTADKVTVAGWFSGTTHRLDSIEIADGPVLEASSVDQMVQAMAGFTPPASGTTSISSGAYPQIDAVITALWR